MRPIPGTFTASTWHNGPDRASTVPVPMHLALPRALTGVRATILVVLGDRFPMIRRT